MVSDIYELLLFDCLMRGILIRCQICLFKIIILVIFKDETFSKVLNLYILNKVKTFSGVTQGRVATVREIILKNKKKSRSGKSQGISFSVREI